MLHCVFYRIQCYIVCLIEYNTTLCVLCINFILFSFFSLLADIKQKKFIGQFDVKHNMTTSIKTITSVLKTDIITKIPTCPFRLTEILVIMSVSTFIIADSCHIVFYVKLTDKLFLFYVCKHISFLML
jgi:hypothetical protein